MARTTELIDDAITSVGHGAGSQILRAFTWSVFVTLVFVAYAWFQFRGISSPEAMEQAQLASCLADGRGFTTKCIRPSDLWFLEKNSPRPVDLRACPDVRNPPLYPAALAALMKVSRPPFDASTRGLFAPEVRVIIPFGIACAVITALLMYGIASMFLTPRWTLVAILVYIFSDIILANAISGTSLNLAMLLTTGSFYAGLLAHRHISEDSLFRSSMFTAISLLLAAAAFLTDYALLSLPLAIGALLAAARDRRAIWQPITAVLCVILLTSPWILRNMIATGTPLGFSPWQILGNSLLFPGDMFDRLADPQIRTMYVGATLKMKVFSLLREWLHAGLPAAGGGIVLALFVSSFFSKFEERALNHLRWNLLLAIAITMIPVILVGPSAVAKLAAFTPMMIVCGVAFAHAVVTRPGDENPLREQAVAWILVILGLSTVILRLSTPPASPYPPYHPVLASYVSRKLPANAVICTDIPWATAWYTKRTSLLLPQSVDELKKIHPERAKVDAIYLTTRTSDRPYTSDLRTGLSRSWLPLLNGKAPPDFAFTNGIALPPGSLDQMLLLP